MTSTQLNLVAIRYLYQTSKKYNSPFVDRLLDDLMYSTVLENKITYEKIEDNLKKCADLEEKRVMSGQAFHESAQDKVATAEEPTKENANEEKPTRTKRKKKNKDSDVVYWSDVFGYAAFSDVPSEDIKLRIKNAEDKIEENRIRSEAYNANSKKRNKQIRKRGYSLGIDRLVFVDPFYFAADERKGLKLMDSEAKLGKFVNQIEKSAKGCNLNYEILYPKTMSDADVHKYNNMSMMNDWVGERLTHDGNGKSMIPLETEYARELQYEYGTPYFCYTGVISTKQKKTGVIGGLLVGALMVYPLPFALYNAFTPAYDTQYYFLLFDVDSGYTGWAQERTVDAKGTGSTIMSLMYDTFYQVKRQPKK